MRLVNRTLPSVATLWGSESAREFYIGEAKFMWTIFNTALESKFPILSAFTWGLEESLRLPLKRVKVFNLNKINNKKYAKIQSD